MPRFLQTGALILLAIFISGFEPPAHADGRIAPGAVIPLDPGKASDKVVIAEIIGSCFYEEAMSSMFPELTGIESSPSSVITHDYESQPATQRSGSGSAWTTTAMWTPVQSSTLTFAETGANGKTEDRQLQLRLSSEYGAPSAEVMTDYKNLGLSAYFSLPVELAKLQVVSNGGQACGINNWGRNVCAEVPEVVSAVNLVIPADFVPGGNWTNTDTQHETAKRFDYFKYADCVLWKWEN